MCYHWAISWVFSLIKHGFSKSAGLVLNYNSDKLWGSGPPASTTWVTGFIGLYLSAQLEHAFKTLYYGVFILEENWLYIIYFIYMCKCMWACGCLCTRVEIRRQLAGVSSRLPWEFLGPNARFWLSGVPASPCAQGATVPAHIFFELILRVFQCCS